MADIIEQLIAAMNRHDATAVAACFAADYRSEQPLHPNRGFGGSRQVLANWTSVFEGVPDFFAEQLASADAEGAVWTEMRWTGTHLDGSPFLMRGVTVIGVREDKIAWARLYMEPVEQGGAGIETASRRRCSSFTARPRASHGVSDRARRPTGRASSSTMVAFHLEGADARQREIARVRAVVRARRDPVEPVPPPASVRGSADQALPGSAGLRQPDRSSLRCAR